ncbi:hypothetical protein EIY71_11030 [Pseudomonas sp. CH235]|nr:hypothetical protein EIY71_11030 [Pseudomonas sp. CH235]
MPQWTLCVRFGTRSVPGCIPTRTVRRLDVGTITSITPINSATVYPRPFSCTDRPRHALPAPFKTLVRDSGSEIATFYKS